jgi:hypothetical protein
MRGKFRAFYSVIAMSVLLVACASQEEIAKRIAGRWGPDPIINADDADTVIKRQMTVLAYVTDASGIGSGAVMNPLSDPRWFEVARWGFNIGREDCASYLNNLFKIQREKLRNHDVLNAFQVASIGIVTAASPHAATTLSVLGQAFGLASSLNDAILQSYLFTEAPGLISIKVKQLQDDYQNSLKPQSITTSSQAYSALQNYYNICLPQSIEGVVLQKVAGADTSSDGGAKPKASAKPAAPAGTSGTVQKTPLLVN